MSLLSVLAGVSVPVPRAAVAAERDPGAGVPPAFAASPMSAADVEAWLDYEVSRPVPDTEFATGVTSGNLSPRSVYLALPVARQQRIGQHRLVEVHQLIAEGTVEDRIVGTSTIFRSRSLPQHNAERHAHRPRRARSSE